MENSIVSVETRGRKPTFANKFNKVAALNNPNGISKVLAMQLFEQGYFVKELVKSNKRGRPAIKFVLTGKAKGYLALAARWKEGNVNLPKPCKIFKAHESHDVVMMPHYQVEVMSEMEFEFA